jgi:outer membrane protein assembly factor BamB
MRTCLTLLLITLVVMAPHAGADWPAWRGPERTGISKETGLLKTWPESGPKLVWKSDKAGLGYAGMAVVGGVVYTMGARDKDEYLIALDDKGQEKWATKMGPVLDWDANSWSHGPNATPTVDGERVYGLSSRGALLCANRTTGAAIWRVDLIKDLGGEVNPAFGGYDEDGEKLGWGYSWSPLLDGDALILLTGGSKGLFTSLNKKTGTVNWRSKAVTDQATYASHVVATIGGTRQYLALTQNSLVSVSARDGSLLWRHKREEEFPDVVCPTPIVKDNLVYISVGKSGCSELLRITGAAGKFKVETVWSNKVLCNRQGGVILVGKHLYGYHEDQRWVCQDFETGEVIWPKARMRQSIKAAGMLLADGRFYALDESANVGMFEASSAGFKVVSQFKLPATSTKRKSQGGIWTHPSLSEGKLYVRDQELVYCYQVK